MLLRLGLPWRRSPERDRPVVLVVYWARTRVQQHQGVGPNLTKGAECRRGGAGWTSARTGGEVGAELVAGVEERASGRLGGAGRRVVLL